MGKTYIDTVKYMVKANVEIDGIVEKPDVVGAIFGQTEGLLTDELELRELLKSGRIGRIEVDLKVDHGKSTGTLAMPSSLDKGETAIIAAVLETVDRVGPCTAKIKVTDIEDTRSNKMDFVMSRAKELMKGMGEETKETKEMTDELKDSLKTAKLVEYGEEKLAAGPDVDTAEEVIVVEGRADVLSLLRAGVNNCIALQGAVIPKTVIELSKRKPVTLFVDGDRGGDMVVRNFVDQGRVEYVTKAPDGKEVEELVQKEILKCLKNRLPFKRFAMSSSVRTPLGERSEGGRRERGRRGGRDRRGRDRAPMGDRRPSFGGERPAFSERPAFGGPSDRMPAFGGEPTGEQPRFAAPKTMGKPDEALTKVYDKIKGSMKAVLLDNNGKTLDEVPVAEMINRIQTEGGIDKVVFDGIITQRLIDLASSKGVKTLLGLKKAKIEDEKGLAVFTMA